MPDLRKAVDDHEPLLPRQKVLKKEIHESLLQDFRVVSPSAGLPEGMNSEALLKKLFLRSEFHQHPGEQI
jgi:hypothetical protein